VALPPLPELQQLGDWCRETADAERVQPWTVEKDFFLTRLIWALAEVHGRGLLIKGGTCLSKVDLGYHRMSEDVDLTIPGTPSGYRVTNAGPLNRVVQSLRVIAPGVGVELVNFDGTRSEHGAHAIWDVRYPSSFLPAASAVIAVEVAIRPRYLDPRKAPVLQLLPVALVPGHADAYCWALDFAEVRAEKVRAAFTRDVRQIRDFYDLGLLIKSGADMNSEEFREFG
jgi:predicted nucleotidyltransferase component of viral defense system